MFNKMYHMRNNVIYLSMLALVFTLSSCELAGDIFKGGFYLGIIVVLAVIGLIVWLIKKFK